MKFKEKLIKLIACKDAIDWAGDMTIEQVWETCDRGDWMLWLAAEVGVEKRLLVLTGAHCANTVRHLMKDERSINAVDVAIRYGEGKATEEELSAAYYDAVAALAAVRAAAASAAAYYAAAAAAAVRAASAAAVADAAAASYAASYADAYAAAALNRKQTADIVRKYIPVETIIEKL
jgi:hypothetical protein